MELRFGNAEAMVETIELIARRKGIGAILAEGSRRAAEAIGGGAAELAMQVKGLELGMHEPRLKQGLGLLYSVASHGADHCTGIHDTAFSREGAALQHLQSLDIAEPLPPNDLSPANVSLAKAHHLWRLCGDSLGVCYFVPWSIDQEVEIVRAVTGWNYTVYEAMKMGERVATISRVFNLREGFTAADDQLPKRFFSPTPRGALKQTAIDPQAMAEAIRTFYELMGWERETGIPTSAKLAELGISWVADELPAA